MDNMQELRKKVCDAIDENELTELILELSNIKSPYLFEEKAGQYVYDWMKKEGFKPRKVGLNNRFNVVGKLGGSGDGQSILFSSHLDTGGPRDRDDDLWMTAEDNIENPYWHSASIVDGKFFGQGVDNDKGPMACFLIAAKAIKKAGIPLKGDIYLTACPGEMGQEPVSEYQGEEYISKDVGAEYMMIHGGIMADFGVSAEGTDFDVSWVEAGKAFFKIIVHGSSVYTPVIRHSDNCAEHVSPIIKTAPLIEALNKYAIEYEKKYTIKLEGGTIVPKIQIGAVRGGLPYFIIGGSEVCELYLDVRINPGMVPYTIYKDLKTITDQLGLKADIELFLFRQGYEADSQAIKPFIEALDISHQEVFGQRFKMSAPVFSSMWRDHNVFNEYKVPSITYGPPRYMPTPKDMVECAKAYALLALEVCMKEKK